MASCSSTVILVWKCEGTLERRLGRIQDDHGVQDDHGSVEAPQLLYARVGPQLIPLMYSDRDNDTCIVKGSQGIREVKVDEGVDTDTGYEVRIFIGSQPLGLKVVNAMEGKLTVNSPDVTTFLYAISTDRSLSCEYQGERWYWLYSGEKVIIKKELSDQMPTGFHFEKETTDD